MIEYRVGAPFPLVQYLGRGELTIAIMNQNFFDVLVCIVNPTKVERQAFRKGKLEVSLFEKDKIPFVIFSLENDFRFDVTIEINKIAQFTDDWLNSNANVVNLFLVDAETRKLEAMRMIAFNRQIAETIRDICEQQTEVSPEIIATKIVTIQEIISSKDMIKNRIKKQLFK